MINETELGRRLKAAREQLGLTQAQAAAQLGLSRAALAQIELGMRAPNSLQLARLAEIYQRELGELLADDFDPAGRDALVALFRSDSQIADDPARAAAVRRCVALAREYTHLEEILGIAAERPSPPEYDLLPPRTRWDAIQQGERLADEERDRLGLGSDPIRDIRTVLEQQGIRVLEEQLPANVSGVFLNDQPHGLVIIVNGSHHSRRRLFSYAHEYAHALADRDVASLVSKLENRSELREVRANAFAAAFLMPDAGVRAFMRSRGKGDARSVLQVFDGSDDVLTAQRRTGSRGQEIQLYDVVHVASHFGTSFDSALYRLLNLRIISEAQREQFAGQRDLANEIRSQYFGEDEQEEEQLQHPHKDFLFLALDAFRHAEISRGKLTELAALAEAPADFDQLARDIETQRDDEDEVLLPPSAVPV
jgi:Zn-dependent peptidase ImmA (M78 family)/DNA-binding XRE family transcriptional regulator